MFNQLLNIAASTQWQANISTQHCTQQVLSWLLDDSSLTNKLEGQCQEFNVQVKQQLNTNSTESTLSPYFPYPEKVLVREVLLYCDGVAHVFAQTEIPYSTLSDAQEKLANLGSESLGRVLFKNATLQRSKIEIAEFNIGSEIHAFSESLQQTCQHSLWARRSVFYIENKPLLVSEVFLPASGIYK
ncbi:chorismate lyase [Psychromonas sp. RZ22]|uniref:chorismate--pyruvate lyase family protein n=1 Tax=Psychromonas algarum TaxID=2555643 RepID=UPI0010675FBD|nr:chorismate lyase [Psychromonas sp. RZ22]TEW54223.1 chorismate lyase [Psychromonas sp. RZ22]